MARRNTDVCRTSGSSPFAAISSPPRVASARPVSDSGTSTQPVNRLSLFHSLPPWRRRPSVPGAVTAVILPDRRTAGSRCLRAVSPGQGGGPVAPPPGGIGEGRERLQVPQRLPALDPPGPFALDRGAEADL